MKSHRFPFLIRTNGIKKTEVIGGLSELEEIRLLLLQLVAERDAEKETDSKDAGSLISSSGLLVFLTAFRR